MTSIAELLDRVRAATGPDRELDGALALMEGWTFQKMEGDRVAYWRKPGATKGWDRATSGPPLYTSSVDAALSLVEGKLPGWGKELMSPAGAAYGSCRLFPGDDRNAALTFFGHAVTLPLAIIEALLSALSNPEVNHDAR